MGNKIDHAKHNEKLSLQLFEEKVFLDWANTTAFYSALQYVQIKILPNTYNGKSCSTLDQAANALNLKGKHTVTLQMVRIVLPSIEKSYRFLMDSSFTARYNNYKVHPEQAKLCQKFLKEIKNLCDAENE